MDILKEQLNRTKELMGILNEQTNPYEECEKIKNCMFSDNDISGAKQTESQLISDGYKKVETIDLPDGIYGSGGSGAVVEVEGDYEGKYAIIMYGTIRGSYDGVDYFGEGRGKMRIVGGKPDPANWGPYPKETEASERTRFTRGGDPARPADYYSIVYNEEG